MSDASPTDTTRASDAGAAAAPIATRRLGASEVFVSEITLGLWGLLSHAYGPVEEDTLERTVEAAWGAGVRTFDVAPFWGPTNAAAGEGERRLGEALGSRREEAVVIGRVGVGLEQERLTPRLDPFLIVHDVEASLARLQLPRFGALLVHGADARQLLDGGYAKAMEHLLEQGLVSTWGASIGTVGEARIAVDHGARVLCFAHNLVRRELLRELDRMIRAHELGVLVHAPLLYGTLSGRFDRATVFAPDDHRSARWKPDAWQRRVDEIERYRFLVTGDVPDLATGALRYVLSSPLVTSALVGARTPAQIEHAARASRLPPYLPAEHVARIVST